ncbi:SDR family oxidoreductase [Rhodococcus sp. BP-349]|uniref:SDR family NAD(P)-dependent oxidoreductase n=1 Tax=unclassified Rhodococcus (in: high G+C Gram-positive bacteria) TaxID=192944 RepID=UPI001C9B9C3B|nr:MULTISPECIES: SDR family oxidoreductase [unclassified Rhodococcus (in: high G+C Gram-positive bacteria)]MBY6537771.1 SDR family oxidoreductase [Rhodococcus sp. BP-363]MBY6542108.1 SDR family oxidoreductase [Rhodococcus sp. BP-369]MBY6561338.1 SDR family oxidoreductase [Rhodococcus sp. BP-370]MBY6575630.1 SDR family oxidoreductase [Rhodococcus sp. BP-364]MBY6584931.1 SDR family oxidoreductase [Rhodococcus sp. BP-358]
MFDLSAQSVVVTGGGTGLGRAITLAMARSGATVFIAGRRPDALHSVAALASAEGLVVVPVPTDISERSEVEALVQTVLDRTGRLDTFVNNAGGADRDDTGPLIDLDVDQFERVISLNLTWTFFAAQSAARAMTRGGSIINITSRSATGANPMTGQYGAAKAAIENLTRTMAVEWGHLGIRVNAVAPGLVITENNSQVYLTVSRLRRQLATVPLQRLGRPDDVGPACVYLASDEAQWVSGVVVPVNGGSTIPVGLLTYLHHRNSEVMDAAAFQENFDPSRKEGED